MWLVDLDLLMKSSHLSSRSGRDFWSKFKAVTPIEIRGVQKDFRSKFLGEFAQELEKSGYIERFNRTLEEEFIEYRESGC
ncbi:MAG: hypothetical protein RMI93_03830 [Caldimicrobium sp.]|nr:hypothetical protein [Caldimicrobium sp.]MDW8182718.1 hypothetical protein [Caldimicrobium sp.]